jgi:hypothetical protein
MFAPTPLDELNKIGPKAVPEEIPTHDHAGPVGISAHNLTSRLLCHIHRKTSPAEIEVLKELSGNLKFVMDDYMLTNDGSIRCIRDNDRIRRLIDLANHIIGAIEQVICRSLFEEEPNGKNVIHALGMLKIILARLINA